MGQDNKPDNLQQDKEHQRLDPLDSLFNQGFLQFYAPGVLKLVNLNETQEKELTLHLTNPLVREYFRVLAHGIIKDILKLRFERPDDQLKLAARFNYAMGALELLDSFIQFGDQNAQPIR